MSEQPKNPTLNSQPTASPDAADAVHSPVAQGRRRLLTGGLAAAPLVYSAAARSQSIVLEKVTTASPLAQAGPNTPSGIFSGNVSGPGLTSQYELGESPEYFAENPSDWALVTPPALDGVTDPSASDGGASGCVQPVAQVEPQPQLMPSPPPPPQPTAQPSGRGRTRLPRNVEQGTLAQAGARSYSTPQAQPQAKAQFQSSLQPQVQSGFQSQARPMSQPPLQSRLVDGTNLMHGGRPARAGRERVAQIGASNPSQLGATFASVFGNDSGLKPLAPDDGCGVAPPTVRPVTMYEVLAFPDEVSDTKLDGRGLGRFAQAVAGAYLNSVKGHKYPVAPQQVKAMWNGARTGAGYCPSGYCGSNVWYAKDVMAYLQTTW